LAASLLIVLGYLLVASPVANRILGIAGAVLLAVLLKVVFELSSQLSRVERVASRMASQLVESSTRFGAELSTTIELQQQLRVILEQTQGELQQRTASLESEFSDSRERFSRAEKQIQSLIGQTQTRIESVEKTAVNRDAAVERHEGLVPDVGMLMGSRFQSLPRSLGSDQRGELLEWANDLALGVESESIDYLARKLVSVEALCKGRLAASTADGVFRALVARSLGLERTNVLEIGVLFGLNAAFLWDTVGFTVPGWHQTLIDPFTGYYGKALDRFTGLPVTRDITESNLNRVGAPPDTWRILEGYSTDEWVLQSVSDRSYDLVFVDGDHSYEGVSFDMNNYGPLVKSQGILMVDDYGAQFWPGVTEYVDEFLTRESDFDHVGTYNHTAIFRRR